MWCFTVLLCEEGEDILVLDPAALRQRDDTKPETLYKVTSYMSGLFPANNKVPMREKLIIFFFLLVDRSSQGEATKMAVTLLGVALCLLLGCGGAVAVVEENPSSDVTEDVPQGNIVGVESVAIILNPKIQLTDGMASTPTAATEPAATTTSEATTAAAAAATTTTTSATTTATTATTSTTAPACVYCK